MSLLGLGRFDQPSLVLDDVLIVPIKVPKELGIGLGTGECPLDKDIGFISKEFGRRERFEMLGFLLYPFRSISLDESSMPTVTVVPRFLAWYFFQESLIPGFDSNVRRLLQPEP